MSCPDAPFWQDTEAHGLSQITKLSTYKLIPLPPGCSVIGLKWVNKIKHGNTGEITQYHVCVVTQCYTQCPGIDFFETYAPVTQIESVWTLLSIAASLDWEIHVINIDSAFFNSNLPGGEDIYLKHSKNPLVMLLRARKIMPGFSFGHCMVSNSQDTSGMKN